MNLIREVCRQQYEQTHSIFYWQSQNGRFACIRSLFNGLETSLWAASERFWVFFAPSRLGEKISSGHLRVGLALRGDSRTQSTSPSLYSWGSARGFLALHVLRASVRNW